MPSSLFGPNSAIPAPPQQANPQISQTTEPDPIAVAEQELRQSGGNAKTAFYSLAKKKGIDPDSVLKQINSMGDVSKLIPSMMSQNPRINSLFRLFSGLK